MYQIGDSWVIDRLLDSLTLMDAPMLMAVAAIVSSLAALVWSVRRKPDC